MYRAMNNFSLKLLALAAALTTALMAGCASSPREITGTLVSRKTGAPAGNVQLVLESSTNAPAVTSVMTIPQRPVLASTTTEKEGHFSFVTRSSKALIIRPVGRLNPAIYKVNGLMDTYGLQREKEEGRSLVTVTYEGDIYIAAKAATH